MTSFENNSRKTRKHIHNFFSTILIFLALFGAYKSLNIIDQLFDEVVDKGIKFSGFFDGVSYLLSNTIFTQVVNNTNPSASGFVMVPAGKYIDGDIGDTGFHNAKDIDGKWKFLEKFEINQNEVTISEYAEFLDSVSSDEFDHYNQPYYKTDHVPLFWNNAGHVPPEWYAEGLTKSENLPIVGVDWWDVYAYCSWAGGALPTSDQWEKAYRGINGKYWPWGMWDLSVPQANTCVGDLDDRHRFASPAGIFKNDKSTFQVYDMAGNVSEWCQSDKQDGARNQPVKGFNFDQNFCFGTTPAIFTDYVHEDSRKSTIGFRCIRDVE